MCWSEDNEGKYVVFRLRVSDYFKAHFLPRNKHPFEELFS